MYAKRKGQVFLILTILVISFIIGISTVLLQIKQSDFIDPAPDANTSFRAWEITVESLHQITDVFLSQYSKNFLAPIQGFNNPFQNLRDYLTNRGVANTIYNTTNLNLSNDNTTITNGEIITASISFNVYLATASTTINQTVSIIISYTIDASTVGVISVYKTVDGTISYLADCQFSIIVVDLGNGSYTHGTTGIAINALTPSNVFFQVTTA